MVDSQRRLIEARKDHKRTINKLYKAGEDKANAEKDYKVALAKKLYTLRHEGQPATLCQDLARGDEEVATLRMDRDLSVSLYEVTLEKIRLLKSEIASIEKDIEYERKGI